MRILKTISIIILISGLIACADNKEYPNTLHSTLPKGYSILCNVDRKYIVVMPYGTKVYKELITYTPFDTYQEALDRAWVQYEYINPAPDTTKWKRCEL